MQLTPEELKIVGPIIRSTAKAHSKRFFKSEKNTPERSEQILKVIDAEVALSLMDAGISLNQLAQIDAEEIIRNQMIEDGYAFADELPLWESVGVPVDAV